MADIGEKIIDLALAIYILRALEKPATICESTCNLVASPASVVDSCASDLEKLPPFYTRATLGVENEVQSIDIIYIQRSYNTGSVGAEKR